MLFAYFPMLSSMHYSLDSYSVYYDVNIWAPLTSGRLIFALIFYLFNILGLNPVQLQTIEILSFIVLVAAGSTILGNVLLKNSGVENKFLYLFIPCILLSTVNVFFLEYFLYPEVTIVYSVGFFFMVLAVYFSLQKMNLKNICITITCLIVVVNCYQAFFAYYIIFSITGTLLGYNCKYSINLVKIVSKNLCCGMVVSLIQVSELKILSLMGYIRNDNKEISFNLQQLEGNFFYLLEQQKTIWMSADGFLPKGILIVIFFMAVGLLIYLLKNSLKDLLNITILFVGCYLSIFVMHLLVGEIWLAPRTITAFFAFLSAWMIVLLYISLNSEQCKKIIICLTLVLLAINFFQIQDVSKNHFISIALDKEFAELIEIEISEYESNSGNTITKIASFNDANPTYFYPEVKYCKFDTNVRAFVIPWADVNLLNYYTNNNYQKIEMPEEIYIERFSGKDWKYFIPEEQLYFQDDVMFWAKY